MAGEFADRTFGHGRSVGGQDRQERRIPRRNLGLGMVSRVSHTTFDCRNAFESSEWWKQVLGYVDVADDPNEAGHEECMILDPNGGHRLLFIEVNDLRSGDGRIHLDLAASDRGRDDEIDRVIALGATEVADRRNPDGTGWMVLADPDGNRFCILRSDEERANG